VWRDTERCYQAVTSRTSRGVRFDVQFIMAVTTAASNAGRPAVPGSPEWDARADLAARAMRLISDGAVERDGVPGWPRLGYSERQLSRVLIAELGAGPLALVQRDHPRSVRDHAVGASRHQRPPCPQAGRRTKRPTGCVSGARPRLNASRCPPQCDRTTASCPGVGSSANR
jgi:methylphosphotriester-DNA--protein-cysteine methyltransferase